MNDVTERCANVYEWWGQCFLTGRQCFCERYGQCFGVIKLMYLNGVTERCGQCLWTVRPMYLNGVAERWANVYESRGQCFLTGRQFFWTMRPMFMNGVSERRGQFFWMLKPIFLKGEALVLNCVFDGWGQYIYERCYWTVCQCLWMVRTVFFNGEAMFLNDTANMFWSDKANVSERCYWTVNQFYERWCHASVS